MAGLAATGRDASILPVLPSCTAHTSHLSATCLSHGLSVAFHCHRGRCRDSVFIHSSECNCTENGVCNGGLHGDGFCFCAEGWTGDRCEIRLGEECQAPPPAIPWNPVPYGCFPSSWIVQAAGQKYVQKGALSCGAHPEIWPVLLNFTRAGVVRRRRKAPLNHEQVPELRGAPRRARG